MMAAAVVGGRSPRAQQRAVGAGACGLLLALTSGWGLAQTVTARPDGGLALRIDPRLARPPSALGSAAPALQSATTHPQPTRSPGGALGLRSDWRLGTADRTAAPTPVAQAAGLGVQPRGTGPEERERLIVAFVLNGMPKGDMVVVAAERGDYWVRGEDLRAMGVHSPRGQPVTFEGERFHSLRDAGAQIRFDEAKLALEVSFPPEQLPRTVLDMLPGRPQRVVEPRDNSAFLNYRVLRTGSNAGGGDTLTAGTELGLRAGDFLFRTDSNHIRSQAQRQDIRYATSLTHDDRRTLRRWVVGDFTASSGELGTSLDLAGVSFSRSFEIDPYFLRQPLAGFTAPVAVPANAEIAIDGVRVRTVPVQPGQFELRNLNSYGGRRDVTIVLRDQFGRAQALEYPYYFTEQNLRRGLHEYSYNLGFQRQQLGVLSNRYGRLALSAFHRYGLNDDVTLGLRGEAEAGRHNLGPVVLVRSDRLGVASAGLSRGAGAAGAGWAGVLRHTYQARRFNSQLSLRRQAAAYETLGQGPGAERLRRDVNATLGYTLGDLGSFSIGYRSAQRYGGADQQSQVVSYSKTLLGSLSLLATLERVTGAVADTHFSLALSYSPSRDLTASLFYERRGGSDSSSFHIGNSTPVGAGWGYRIAGGQSQGGAQQRLNPSVQYNGPHGLYSAELQSERTSGRSSRDSYQLGLAGGIAAVAGSVAFLRPVTDSFGIVQVGRLPGVRVYHSAQEIGRTDAQGRVFLPNLGSYQANRVAIDDRDVPIDYTISDKEVNISPPLRSGSLIRFEVNRTQAVTGRLRLQATGASRPAEYLDLKVQIDGKILSFPTGEGGEFYLDGLRPGRFTAALEGAGAQCEFELTVPESDSMLVDLGVLHVCNFAR